MAACGLVGSGRDAKRIARTARARALRTAVRVLAAVIAAGLLADPAPTRAQVVGTLGLASQDRYRGVGADGAGPVLRASLMADSPWPASAGAYAGLSGLLRTRDAGLASIDALLGWSGRLDAFDALSQADPGWGWDIGLHRRHDGQGRRYDFSELMAGLLAPAGAARLWWAPHYFGGSAASVYGEVNASQALGSRWQLFGHVGVLRYGAAGAGRVRPAGRADGRAGIAWVGDAIEFRLARDGLVDGHALDGTDSRRRSAAWLLDASVAF